jgi:predicted 2-oxoglutarate/Fe(II)-dependent dioxygenase YbiX
MSLGRGERAPDFILPTHDGTQMRFYGHAGGKPVLLVFADERHLQHLIKIFPVTSDFDLFAVVRDPPTAANPPFTVFIDSDGKISSAFRPESQVEAIVYALDPNLRVLYNFELDDSSDAIQLTQAALDEQGIDRQAAEITGQAPPVLMIPNTLNAEICEHLIETWEAGETEFTGVEQSAEGRREEKIAGDLKRRRDLTVTDDSLIKLLSSTVGRRVIPELRKAFAYHATRFEGFKIACYEADVGGFFHAHRDNLSPSTAHRRFAMSLNLNDEYDGGQLRFPEYGCDLFRPAAGAALLFSCAHLHEVLPVSSGRRFVLLSFLFADEAARQNN